MVTCSNPSTVYKKIDILENCTFITKDCEIKMLIEMYKNQYFGKSLNKSL